jgi:hypothetical protein
MYDIPIPDSLYQQATQAAQAHHVSVETFVVEAVQLRLQDEPLRLSPEQVAIIRQSQAEIKAGKGLTMEQVETRLATKKAEWLAANPA